MVEWPGAIAGVRPSKNWTWRFSVIRLEHPQTPPLVDSPPPCESAASQYRV